MENTQETLTGGFELALEKMQSWGNDFYLLLPNLIAGALLALLFILIAYIMRRSVRAYFGVRGKTDLGQIVSGFAFWALISFGLLVALTVITPSIEPADLLSSLGIGSIAIGFAFKDILQNWLAGLLILLRAPFRRGDQIHVDGVEGTVIRIEPRATIIRTYDGRDIVVPNTTIFTNKVTIHTSQSIRRTEIDITVGYDYDIRMITTIIQNSLAQVEEILKDPPPQVLCWDLGSTSLGIKVRWWISAERAQQVIARARAVQAIKEAFEANDIDPTDPQLIFYKEQKLSETVQSPSVPVAGPPPEEVVVSRNDPEADRPTESKKETMLPES